MAPRGIATIYLGLGFSRGQKGWICYDPIKKETYCSRNVVFDETFFPMRVYDQRVFGHYDTAPRQRLAVAEYGSVDAAAKVQADINDMPITRIRDTLEDISEKERKDISHPPCGRNAHQELNQVIINALDDDESDG
jgi:hypothetical protein